MAHESGPKKDHWSTEDYSAAANFVPLLTSKVTSYLNPTPDDIILDIGCGDGILTEQIAASAHKGIVIGLDASPAMIAAAQAKSSASSASASTARYAVHDCTQLASFLSSEFPGKLAQTTTTAAAAAAAAAAASTSPTTAGNDKAPVQPPTNFTAHFSKVFSNAALHWILRSPTTRKQVFVDIYNALQPGGVFVFEMGGAGNVAEVYTALLGGLAAVGNVSVQEAREASPWFFPSEKWMAGMLAEVGFEVERAEMEYRPTRLTKTETEKGKGGLEGWVRLMGAQFLDVVKETAQKEEVVRWVVRVLEPVVKREEDGSWWIGYVRLRGIARKPIS